MTEKFGSVPGDVFNRAWEPAEGEATGRNGGKPWAAFKVYRDLGPGRTLRVAAAAFYGHTVDTLPTHHHDTFKRWSSKYDWVARARAYDDWFAFHDRSVIEEFQRAKAHEFAERQMALKEQLLVNAEKAAEQASQMLDWPLTEQTVVREGPEGEDVTYVFVPAGWSKATARAYQDMAAGAVVGAWAAKEHDKETDDEFDFSDLTQEELMEFLRVSEKLGIRGQES